MKKIFSVITTVIIFTSAFSQQNNLDYIKNEFYKINKLFDSSYYFIKFKTKYVYNTDTLNGQFESSTLDADYIVNGRRFLYTMGPTEIMQNDSFAFTLFHDDGKIIMSKTNANGSSQLFPLKNIVNTTLDSIAKYYSMSTSSDEVNMERTFTFKTDSIGLPYDQFSVSYDTETYYPTKMEFRFREITADPILVSDEDSNLTHNDTVPPVIRKKTMMILFSNFSTGTIDNSIFDEHKYVLYDPSRKRYIKAEKYKGYTLYVSGVERQDPGEEFPEVNN
jgi:hypothetical protein